MRRGREGEEGHTFVSGDSETIIAAKNTNSDDDDYFYYFQQ